MALNIGRAVTEGAERTATRNGLVLVAAFSIVGVLGTVGSLSMQRYAFRNVGMGGPTGIGPSPFPPFDPAGGFGLGLGLPLPVILLLVLVSAVAAEALRIVTLRTFVSEYTEEIPGEYWSRRIAMATLNGIVGNIVASILIGIGLLFLILPGVFFAISFMFLRAVIAVEDENFIDAMGTSWVLSKGNRLPLLGLLVIVFVIAIAVGAIGFFLGSVVPPLAAVVNAIVSAVGTVFGIAVVARAYRQVRDARDRPDVEHDEFGGAVTV